ncbi:MAG TPA: family 43 glycosylhydrolase, partial [Labilithrix sp.]
PKPSGKGFPGAYSSPTIVRVGTTYHAYFAKQSFGGKHYNVPHAKFDDAGNFTVVGEALPKLGAGADDTDPYEVWAPAVAQIDATHWMLYYAATVSGTVSKKCIWRAHASDPDGPFVDDYAGPLVCSDASQWSIDPYVVKDDAGTWQLSARIDQPGGINTIQNRPLGPQGESFAAGSDWTELTHNAPTSWEQPVLENAAVVQLTPPSGPAHWFVFYSGGAWDKNTYAVGYADCGTSLTGGACVKKTPTGPWMASDKATDVWGPGTPTFYTNASGATLMSVQAWQYSGGKSNAMNNGQIMRTYTLTIDNAYVPTATLVRVDL